jgi:cytochrome c peroxidase
MNIQKKIIYNVIVFSSVIIIVIVCMTLYLSFYQNTNPGCGTKSDVFICGTESISEENQAGKTIFNSNCAACHKLNAKSTGPALRSTDSIKYWKIMTQIRVKIDTTETNKFGKEYHQSFFQNLTKQDLENIYLYLK